MHRSPAREVCRLFQPRFDWPGAMVIVGPRLDGGDKSFVRRSGPRKTFLLFFSPIVLRALIVGKLEPSSHAQWDYCFCRVFLFFVYQSKIFGRRIWKHGRDFSSQWPEPLTAGCYISIKRTTFPTLSSMSIFGLASSLMQKPSFPSVLCCCLVLFCVFFFFVVQGRVQKALCDRLF